MLTVLVIPTLRESDKWKAARELARENLSCQMGDLKSMFGQESSTLAAPWHHAGNPLAIG
jgi:hypothetical protein